MAQVEHSSVEGLERGYSGTARTIDKMHQLVAAGKLDPTVQKIAQWIRLQVPGDYFGQTKKTADAVFNWVKRNGIFTRDQFQVEKIQHPLATMLATVAAKRAGTYSGPGLFQGDCDDFAIWVATLGGILGFQYQFATAKTDESRPDEFSHIWAELQVDDGRQKLWYPLDASTPSAYPGWRPPVSKDRIQDWPEKHIEEVGVRGLGRYPNGMGEAELPPREEGWSAEQYIPHTAPEADEPLVPMQPATTYGDEVKMSEALYKAPAPRPFERPALMETMEQVPRYENWGAEKVRQISVSTPYPYDWPWARQVEVVYPGVTNLNGFQRRLRSRRVPRMGMGEPKDNYDYAGTPETAAPTPAQQAAADAASAALTNNIFNSINTVAKVFGGVSQAQADAEKAKYQAMVNGAVANATGVKPTTPGSPYTLPLVIGGGAVTVGIIAYLLSRK